MDQIMLDHVRRYPQMKVQDAVKLLYQREFGNGHMIIDETESLLRLKTEYNQIIKQADFNSPLLCDSIGGGYVRVNLNCLPKGLSLETMNRIFIHSVNDANGSREQFEESLDELERAAGEGELPWHLIEVKEYLSGYRKQQAPVVSHTDEYRKCYHPAYRVISKRYADYLYIFAEIDLMLSAKINKEEPVLIAIDGACTSGKTTLGYLLRNVYDANLFHMDDFFLRPEQRTPQRLAEVGGNVDYERFITEVLEPLKARRDFSYQRYDCGRQCLVPGIHVSVKPLNIVEGVYSRHPYFKEPYDLTYCLTVGTEEQQRRILARNGKDMLKRFLDEWIPKENRYLAMFDMNKEK